jgi:hypothetical protein
MELTPLEESTATKPVKASERFPPGKQMTIFDSGEEHSNEIQTEAVSGKTSAAGGLFRRR